MKFILEDQQADRKLETGWQQDCLPEPQKSRNFKVGEKKKNLARDAANWKERTDRQTGKPCEYIHLLRKPGLRAQGRMRMDPREEI